VELRAGKKAWLAMGKGLLITIALAAALAVSVSCDESLPQYQDPSTVLLGTVRAQYVISFTDNSLHGFFTVKNVYEETFQGQAPLSGTLVMTAKRNPKVQKTFHLTANNITYAANYDRATGVLTIDPGDSVVFSSTWNFIDDAGQDLRSTFFRYVADTSCDGRSIAPDETFLLEGSVKVYDRLPDVPGGPTEYTFCHVNIWVGSHDCPTIFVEPPCGIRTH
jgi:hypothetical protein